MKAEDGREYKLEKFDRARMQYLRLSPTRVRTAWGTLEVDREDDAFFYFRLYRDISPPPGPSVAEQREKKADELRQHLPQPLEEVDGLEGVDFGHGLPTSGQWRNSFEFADMNEDGFLDLVHGPARKGDRVPKVFLGDGKGNWRLWREASFPSQTYDYGDVSVGDFNGDHHLDMVLGVHLLGLRALMGDGKGKFTTANEGLPWRSKAAEPMGFSSQQVQAVTWDDKPKAGFLALSEGPRMPTPGSSPVQGTEGVRLYRNASSDPARVEWEWVNESDKSSDLFGEDLQLVPDSKGRGFLVGSGRMDYRDLVFLGRNKDGWRQQSLPLPPRTNVWSSAPLRRAGPASFDVVTAALSFDAGMTLRLIDLYRMEKTGWTRRTLWFEEKKGQGPVRVATGDLDGNGLDDIVALGADGQVWVLLQQPGDSWVSEKSPELQGQVGCSGAGLRIQDLDADGKPEIAISWSGETDLLNDPKACRDSGSLRVWKIHPRSATTKPQ
ncbi:MAG: VCBS repeat-containing protein [Acidobacteriota bacterium]